MPPACRSGVLWPALVALLALLSRLPAQFLRHPAHVDQPSRADPYDRGGALPLLLRQPEVLLTATFVPFPTAVLAEHLATPDASAAVAFYCGTFVINGLSWTLLLHAIRRGNLFKPEVTPEVIARIRRLTRWNPWFTWFRPPSLSTSPGWAWHSISPCGSCGPGSATTAVPSPWSNGGGERPPSDPKPTMTDRRYNDEEVAAIFLTAARARRLLRSRLPAMKV